MEGRQRRRLLKVIVLGDACTGKTALLSKYVYDRFPPQYKATIGADFHSKEIQTDITLQLWDTAGQERFQSLGVAFYRGADCGVIVYDVTNRSSFDRIMQWKEECLAAGQGDRETFPFVVVGNKADQDTERQVGWSEAQTWVRSHGDLPLFETSALEGSNVKEVFELAGQLALKRTS